MPACAGDGAFPCWNLEPPQIAGPQCEPGATRVVVSWGPKGDHDVLRVTAECAVCTPGEVNPARGCR